MRQVQGGIYVGRADTLGTVDLSGIHRSIVEKEPKMRHPSLESLQEIFANGNASVLVTSEGKVVGFAQMSERFGPHIKSMVGIDREMPDVYECGGIYILDEFRGKRLMTPLVTDLYGAFREGIVNGSFLVFAVTKSDSVVTSIVNTGKAIGLTDQYVHHIPDLHYELATTTAILCNCNHFSINVGKPPENMFMLWGCPGPNYQVSEGIVPEIIRPEYPKNKLVWSNWNSAVTLERTLQETGLTRLGLALLLRDRAEYYS